MEHWRALGELGLCWEWSGVVYSEAENLGLEATSKRETPVTKE